MIWNRSVGGAMSEALEADDLVGFERLLDSNPDHLRAPNGENCWMKRAAMHGQVQFLKALFQRGVGVNESAGNQDPKSEFYEPEGPILWAASQGQIAAVRWFLSQGAQINYTIKGRIRCLPMMFAAKNGHLDVVKLLVEHGGNWQSSDDGRPPAWYAEEYGQSAILEYLQALEQ